MSDFEVYPCDAEHAQKISHDIGCVTVLDGELYVIVNVAPYRHERFTHKVRLRRVHPSERLKVVE